MALNYKPRESSTLDNLLRAMRAGLDPQLGYSLFSGVQGDALARAQAAQAAAEAKQTARQETRQQSLGSLMDLLIAQAQGGQLAPQADATSDIYSQVLPGIGGPKMQGRLDDLLASLYPGPGPIRPQTGQPMTAPYPGAAQGLSQLYQPPPLPASEPQQLETAPGSVDPVTLQGFIVDIQAAKAQGLSAEQARAQILSSPPNAATYLSAQTFFDQVIAQIYGAG